MTVRIRLTYHGMDGEGATIREAKATAGRKIERAIVVEAEGEEAAKAFALRERFDEAELDDWAPTDSGDPKVHDCEQVDDDEPLTPLDPLAAREPPTTVAAWIALSAWGARSGVEFDCRMALANAARDFEATGTIGDRAGDPVIDTL
jgi:hypothetical protein